MLSTTMMTTGSVTTKTMTSMRKMSMMTTTMDMRTSFLTAVRTTMMRRRKRIMKVKRVMIGNRVAMSQTKRMRQRVGRMRQKKPRAKRKVASILSIITSGTKIAISADMLSTSTWRTRSQCLLQTNPRQTKKNKTQRMTNHQKKTRMPINSTREDSVAADAALEGGLVDTQQLEVRCLIMPTRCFLIKLSLFLNNNSVLVVAQVERHARCLPVHKNSNSSSKNRGA